MPVDLSSFHFAVAPDLLGVADRCVLLACVTPRAEPFDRPGMRFSLEPGAVDLTMVRARRCPALTEHKNALDNLVGLVEDAWIDGQTLLALVRLGHSPKADAILSIVNDGLPIGISIGSSLVDSEPDADGPEDAILVKRWALREVTFCAMGEDQRARVIKAGAAAIEMAERHRQRSLEERKKVALSALQASEWRHWSYRVGERLAEVEPDRLSDFLVAEVGQQLDRLSGAMAHEVPPPPFKFAA